MRFVPNFSLAAKDCFDRCFVMFSRNTNQSVERKARGPSADLAEQLMGMNVDSSLIILGSNSFCVQIRDAASENI